MYFPNGSECNLNDDEVIREEVTLENKDKVITYINHINQYFKLVRYERYTGDFLLIPQYETDHYELYMADGSYYYFDGKGKIQYIRGRLASNTISFYYDTNGNISYIIDTVGRRYDFISTTSSLKIVRASDSQTLVTYNFENDELKSVTDVIGRVTTYSYTDAGINQITYPTGKVSKYTYETADYSETYYDENGIEHTYDFYLYWVTGQQIDLVDNDTSQMVKKNIFIYNFSDRSERKINYINVKHYDENNLLQFSTYYHQDQYGMVVREKTIDEKVLKVVQTIYSDYSINKEKIKQKVYYGNIYESTYDDSITHQAVASNKLSKNDDYLITEETWSYDQWGNLIYHKDPEGYETMITYVNSNYETMFYRVAEGNAGIGAFYDNTVLSNKHIYNLPAGKLKIRKYWYEGYDEYFEGEESYYQYDANGNLIEQKTLLVDENGTKSWQKTQYQDYDSYGNCERTIIDAGSTNPITIINKFESEYSYAYLTEQIQTISKNLVDNSGNPLSAQTATVSYEYDFNTGMVTKVTDPEGNSMTYEYDLLTRPVKVTYPKTASESVPTFEEVRYDDANKLVEVYDGRRKNVTVHHFDGLGRTIKIEKYSDLTKTNLDSWIASKYNWQDKVVTSIDELGKETTTEYDIFGRPIKIITDDGKVTTMGYDDLAHKTTTTRPDQVQIEVITDKKGQKIKETITDTANNSNTVQIEYDGFGNIVKTIDAKNQQMGYQYNNLGQLIKEKYPDHLGQVHDDHPINLTESKIYDSKGNLIRTINRKGETINFEYNEYNQIVKVDLPISADINYYYNILGQLVKVQQGNQFERLYTYDARGRLTQKKLIVDPGLGTEKDYVTQYTYNENNQPTEITYPEGAGNLSYTYNNINQINLVKWNGSTLVNNIGYTKTGHLSTLTYGNGVIGKMDYIYINGQYMPQTISYNQSGRNLGVYDYRYDVMGNIIRANNHIYGYDYLGQLTEWKFLKENDRVLLGEEVIWEKEMTDQTELSLNRTYVNDDRLQLALSLNQKIIKVASLGDSGQVSYSSNVEQSFDGYSLIKDPYVIEESFTNMTKINSTLTTAEVNTTTGSVTIPENTSSDRWVTILNDTNDFSISRNSLENVSISLGSKTLHSYYSSVDYENSRDWAPTIYNSKWHQISSSFTISKSSNSNVKTIQLPITCKLINYWQLIGGWGNWTLFLKVRINNTDINQVLSYEVNAVEEELMTKTFTVDLESYGLMNRDLTVDIYYLRNKWGAGITAGGYIETISGKAVKKYYYPINQNITKRHNLGTLTVGNSYWFDTSDSKPSTATTITYNLVNSSGSTVNQLTDGEHFSVPSNGTYYLDVILRTTNHDYTPIVYSVSVKREKQYLSSAQVQLASITLPENCTHIELEPDAVKLAGTDIQYRISNNGGSSWVVPTYSNGKYTADFAASGSVITVKGILYSDSDQKSTPTLNGLTLIIPELGNYRSTGYLTTPSINIPEVSPSLVLELHGLENLGSFDISLNIDGTIVEGVKTTAADLIVSSGDLGLDDDDLTLQEQAESLRTEISGRNLQIYYYRFDLPQNLTTAPFNTTITFKLNASSDRKSTPKVYSYIFLHNYFNYYSSGTFETLNSITPGRNYTFDQVRLDVLSNISTGTTATYKAFGFNGSTEVSLNPGSKASLGIDVDELKIGGSISTTDLKKTPTVSKLTLSAIGETPLMNQVETVSEVLLSDPALSDAISLSTDRVEGNYSLMIDHTGRGYGYYRFNSNQIFDATKLPIIQVWVKPLSDVAIAFATIDQSHGAAERISNDFNNDGVWKTGEDLIKGQWNLILLDLRQTLGGGIAKDAGGLFLISTAGGDKLLFDSISSLPLNEVIYAYDQSGNRIESNHNGIKTTYEYAVGSNHLERRYSINEDVYYTYDANGNLIRQEVSDYRKSSYWYFDYTFNELNQLVEVWKNGTLVAKYYYDHEGLRYKKIDYVSGKTTIYVYGQGTEPIYEEIYNNSNLVTAVDKISYLGMGSKRLARVSSLSGKSFYFTDHLGSTRIVMDTAGNCTYNEYAPFGEDFLTSNGERYKFTGKEDDGDTGLYYYNARYYDPAVGRFISMDPVKDGWNWYVYTKSNPLSFTDPTGTMAQMDSPGCHPVLFSEYYYESYIETTEMKPLYSDEKLKETHTYFNTKTNFFADFMYNDMTVAAQYHGLGGDLEMGLVRIGFYSKDRTRKYYFSTFSASANAYIDLYGGYSTGAVVSVFKLHAEQNILIGNDTCLRVTGDFYALGFGGTHGTRKNGLIKFVGGELGYAIVDR